MKHSKLSLVSLTLLGLAPWAYTVSPSDWKTYRNAKYGWQLKVPPEYTVKETLQGDFLTIEKGSRGYVSVSVRPFSNPVELKKTMLEEARYHCDADGPNGGTSCTDDADVIWTPYSAHELSGYIVKKLRPTWKKFNPPSEGRTERPIGLYYLFRPAEASYPAALLEIEDLQLDPIADQIVKTLTLGEDVCERAECWGHLGCNYLNCTRKNGSPYTKFVQ